MAGKALQLYSSFLPLGLCVGFKAALWFEDDSKRRRNNEERKNSVALSNIRAPRFSSIQQQREPAPPWGQSRLRVMHRAARPQATNILSRQKLQLVIWSRSQLRPQNRQQPSGTAFWSASRQTREEEEEALMETKGLEGTQARRGRTFFKNFIVNNSTKTKSCIYKTMAVSSYPLWFHCWPDYLNRMNKKTNETWVRCFKNGDLLLTRVHIHALLRTARAESVWLNSTGVIQRNQCDFCGLESS